jgi:glycosyltransferase involved in cell wall biosynthesis
MKQDATKRIAVSIIGHNEGHLLDACLKSVSWADELIYVDCESSDNSSAVAKKYTEKIFNRPNNKNLNINKTFGFEKCNAPWILYLDPDERIPVATAEWIKQEIANPRADAYYFPRKNHILGKWLKHGAQYPDYQLRLFLKEKASFPCRHVHEHLQVDGKITTSRFPILHFPYPDLTSYIKKFNFYTTFEAEYLLDHPPGQFAMLKYLFFKPGIRFLKRYIIKGGFLDGMPGLVCIFFDMINFPMRYFKFLEFKQARNKDNK